MYVHVCMYIFVGNYEGSSEIESTRSVQYVRVRRLSVRPAGRPSSPLALFSSGIVGDQAKKGTSRWPGRLHLGYSSFGTIIWPVASTYLRRREDRPILLNERVRINSRAGKRAISLAKVTARLPSCSHCLTDALCVQNLIHLFCLLK